MKLADLERDNESDGGKEMGALPNYKEIVEQVKKGSTVEVQEKIMELRETAFDLKEGNVR